MTRRQRLRAPVAERRGLVPVDLLFVATRAMQRALAELRDRDATLRDPERLASFQEFCDLIGLPEQLGLGQRY